MVVREGHTGIELIAVANPVHAHLGDVVESDQVVVARHAMDGLDAGLVESGEQILWKVSDVFWEHVKPLLPAAPSHAMGGRPRMDDRRDWNSLSEGCAKGANKRAGSPESWEGSQEEKIES